MSRDLTKLHTTAIERFKLTAAVESKQRARELVDLKFADPIEPEDQWPKDALDSRAGLPQKGALPPVPARPALTINKLRQPIQQVQNQQRQARLSLEFSPEGDGASEDAAEAFEDIARAIQSDSRAHLARNWAFDRALKCGRGYYRLEADYVSARSFDQQIVYKRILNQFSVYYYPFCQEPDYSDAEWCFVTEDVPWPEYQRKYGESTLADFNDEELAALGNEKAGWVSENDEGKLIRIAEYYFFETTHDTLQQVQTAEGVREVLKSEQVTGKVLNERPVETRSLRWGKLNGVEFITDTGVTEAIVERDGMYIPIVPVIADESNIAGERRYTGLVRPAMDAQRLFNVEASALAETVHLGPIAPFVGYAAQFEGYEAWWAQLNTRRFPYLPVNPPKNPNEAALPIPVRNTAEQPIQAIVISLQHASTYISDTTGIPPVALGNLDPHDRSGKAIMALQQQADQGTSGYVDNLANMSLLLEGKILRDLIPKIYDRPGRIVSAQGDDDERKALMLNQPFQQQGGQGPQAVQPGTKGAKVIDLTRGQYTVAPTVGKSYATKRQESVAALSDILKVTAQANPQAAMAILPLVVKNMDGPGVRQAADRLERGVPPQFKDDQSGQPDPQALMQQLSQAQQMHDLMAKELEAKTHIIETDQVKATHDLKKAQLEQDTRIRIASIQAEGGVVQAEIKAGMATMQGELDLLHQRLEGITTAGEQGRDHAHELRAAQQAHQQALAQGQQSHDQALVEGEQGQQHALEQGEQAHAATLQQQEQAAELAPEPAGAGA